MPRYPDRLLTDDETVVLEMRPHWRVLIPAVFWTVLAAGAVLFVWFGTTSRPTWLLPTVSLLAAVFVAGLAVPPAVRWFATLYVLTTERIIVRTGIVARSGTEIPLESINNVLFTQGVIERMLGYGDVLIESAGESGQSRIRDVRHPEDFQSRVYTARERRTLHFTGGGQRGGGERDPIAQLESLAALHERGKITDAEYEAQKRRLLGDDGSSSAGTSADTPAVSPEDTTPEA